MDDTWQSEETINSLVRELRDDEARWDLVVDRYRESEAFKAMENEIGKRHDLEPEFFPKKKRPLIFEITGDFLEQKFGKKFNIVNSQLAMVAGKYALEEI